MKPMPSRTDSMRSLVVLGLQVLFLSCIYLPQVWSTDGFHNLTSGGHLNVGHTLVSPSGHFEFGIFQLENGMYHLCIRYAKPIQQFVVWVANRNQPLEVNKAFLELSAGNLELFDHNSLKVWSSNATRTGMQATVARLLDTGNVVLENSNGTIRTWNSFNDSITDTLLPDQYLYRDRRPNLLTSWRERKNPATGNYTFGWSTPNTTSTTSILQLTCQVCKTASQPGVYVPAPDVQHPRIISNVSAVYLHKTLGALYYPSSGPETSTLPPASTLIFSDFQQPSKSTLKRLTLDTDGGLRIWEYKIGQSKVWTPVANWVVHERGTQCFVMHTCGSFGLCQMTPPGSSDRVQCTCPYGFEPIDKTDYSKGCMHRELPSKECNKTLFTMMNLDGIDMPWTSGPGNYTVEPDPTACTALCEKDCNCTGVVHSKDEKRCWKGSGNLYNLGYPTVALYGNDRNASIKISANQPPVHDNEDRKLWILGPVLGGALGIVVLVLCVCRVKRSRLGGKGLVRTAGRQDHGIHQEFSGSANSPPRPLKG